MARRQNPIDFTVMPGQREFIDLRRRTSASMYSPIKHRAITEKARTSPHNFQIVLWPNRLQKPTKEDTAAMARPDAITLLSIAEPPFTASKGLPSSESIYTAFTYLHRLGDEIDLHILRGRNSGEPFPLDRSALPSRFVGGNPPPDPELGRAVRAAEQKLAELAKNLCAALSVAVDFTGYIAAGYSMKYAHPFSARDMYGQMNDVKSILADRVNSKMVREGYASDMTQAASDLLPLAELTPATRPLLRPYTTPEEIRRWSPAGTVTVSTASDGLMNEAAMAAFNAYIAQHNILWRRWYDLFIRASYGAVVEI